MIDTGWCQCVINQALVFQSNTTYGIEEACDVVYPVAVRCLTCEVAHIVPCHTTNLQITVRVHLQQGRKNHERHIRLASSLFLSAMVTTVQIIIM